MVADLTPSMQLHSRLACSCKTTLEYCTQSWAFWVILIFNIMKIAIFHVLLLSEVAEGQISLIGLAQK